MTMQEITQKDILVATGENCHYCEKPVAYFCSICWFAVCEECAQTLADDDGGKCQGTCHDKVPDLGMIDIFKKE